MASNAIRDHYDSLSERYEHRRNRAFFQAATHWLLSSLGPAPKRVLEVGCGTGGYLVEMIRAGHDAVGVELSAGMCRVASERLTSIFGGELERVRQVDFQEEPGFPGPFDAIVSLDSWELFENPGTVLSRAAELLLPAGRVLIMTANPRARWLIEFLEWTGIKPLRPAFWFGQSAKSDVQRAAGNHFRIGASGTLFWGLECWYILERLDTANAKK